jgi:hypothetical protein
MKKAQGNIGEAAVIYHLAKLGLPVFKEIGDSCQVDLITLVAKRPVRIQVKSTKIDKTGAVCLPTRKTGPGGYRYKYQVDDFDVFALYCIDNHQIYWIHIEEALICVHSVLFRVAEVRNNQTKNVRRSEDYLDFYKAIRHGSGV